MAPMTYTMPVIEMLSDYTVRPSYIQVKAGYRLKILNNSGRYFQIHSYNCSQFQMVDPSPGRYTYTAIFPTAGKTCVDFAWRSNMIGMPARLRSSARLIGTRRLGCYRGR